MMSGLYVFRRWGGRSVVTRCLPNCMGRNRWVAECSHLASLHLTRAQTHLMKINLTWTADTASLSWNLGLQEESQSSMFVVRRVHIFIWRSADVVLWPFLVLFVGFYFYIHYRQACLRVAQPCRYCFYSVVQKLVFCPTGATRFPDKCEIWHGWAALPRAKFHVYRVGKCGNTAFKTVKIWNFGQKFVPQGRLICNIFTKFSAFVRI